MPTPANLVTTTLILHGPRIQRKKWQRGAGMADSQLNQIKALGETVRELIQQVADMREQANKPEYLSIRNTLLQSADELEQAARKSHCWLARYARKSSISQAVQSMKREQFLWSGRSRDVRTALQVHRRQRYCGSRCALRSLSFGR